jgi:F-type H+-transporting ATPase subunit a
MEGHEPGSLFNLFYLIPGAQAIGLTQEKVPPFVEAAWFLVIGLSVAVILASRSYSRDNPGKLQSFLELIVEWLEGFCEQSIGPGGKRYTPFVGSVFVFILTLNLLGTVPGLLTPTGNLNTTLAMALTVFVMTPYFGIRAVGAKVYISHLAGKPWWLSWFLFPLNVIEEFVRPVSLSIRLFGNMFADHTMVAIIAMLTFSVPIFIMLAPLAFYLVLTFFGVFVAFVQAFVFTALTTVYIAGAVSAHASHEVNASAEAA